MTELKAVTNGQIIALNQVPDQVFSAGVLGDGIAIRPEEGRIVAPAAGEITMLVKSGHTMGIKIDGMDFLIHAGLNTVELKGDGFMPLVKTGDQVIAGQDLLQFDKEEIEKKGYCTDVIFLKMKREEPDEKEVTFRWGIHGKAGETLIGLIED